MKNIIILIAGIFLILVLSDRLDLLVDIGSSIRQGVDALVDGYNDNR